VSYAKLSRNAWHSAQGFPYWNDNLIFGTDLFPPDKENLGN